MDSLVEALPLSVLTSDAPSKLNVLGHQGDSLSVEGYEVAVLEDASEVALRSLLECVQGGGGEPDIGVGGSRDVTDEPLEGQPRDDGLGLSLHLLDLLESQRAWPESGLLDSSGRGDVLAKSLNLAFYSFSSILPRKKSIFGEHSVRRLWQLL